MTDSKIVPFGKYKGQPVEVMLGDRDYVQWLMAQDWFRQKPLYQLVINYGAEPQETPEHNAMQALFLDDSFCEKFALHLMPDIWDTANKQLAREIQEAKSHREFMTEEQYGKIHFPDRSGPEPKYGTNEYSEYWRQLGQTRRVLFDAHQAARKQFQTDIQTATFKATKQTWKFKREFECGSPPADVYLSGWLRVDGEFFGSEQAIADLKKIPCFTCGSFERLIELKPVVSDDYPAVLRQMRNNRCGTLLTKQYAGQGATREQFIALFKTAGITVVFLDEIT